MLNFSAVHRPRVSSKSGKNLLLAIHAEYTSITDELESVCHMMVSPTQSLRDDKPMNELSNPEFAAFIEKQHLRECEDDDYMIMERLLQTRCSIDEDDISPDDLEIFETSGRRILRRETAIELPITPSKIQSVDGANSTEKQEEFSIKNERQFSTSSQTSCNNMINNPDQPRISPVSSQASPRNSQYSTYLNPTVDTGRSIFKKSSESLQKNSSTETDYSHPYKTIKQGSTETNTSINSSFAIDNSSFTNDLSLDHDTSMNQTVIEQIDEDRARTPITKRACSLGSSDMRPLEKDVRLNIFRKQFSIDHGIGIPRPKSDNFESSPQIMTPQNQRKSTQQSNLCPNLLQNKLQILKESSSTSTEDTKDEINIPSISTNVVQDEIAKLSSTIKSSTEEDQQPPYNETMC